MPKGRPILWDVDTQADFVLPGGKLYVPGSELVAPAMARLVAAARAAGIVHVASADDHELTDPEISGEPDWQSTFPPHCLRGTRGAEKVPETRQEDPLPLPQVPLPPGLLPRLIAGRRELLILKKSFDPFTNPNADPVLEALDPSEVILFGIATDVCDDYAVRALLLRGRRVRFVEDAARALDADRAAACTALWRKRGVAFTTAAEAVLQV